MALGRTEFIDGVFVTYPVEYLPKLFAVVGAISRRAFFEKLAELDGEGGEGLSIDQMAEMIRIGLMTDRPGITIEETMKMVSIFNAEHGLEALENFIVDAFADAKLSDKRLIEQRRQLLAEIKELEMKRLEYAVQARETALRETEIQLQKKVADMGEQTKTTPKIQLGNRGRKPKLKS